MDTNRRLRNRLSRPLAKTSRSSGATAQRRGWTVARKGAIILPSNFMRPVALELAR